MNRDEAVAAVKADPQSPRAWLLLGYAMLDEGHYGRARECLERAGTLQPSDHLRELIATAQQELAQAEAEAAALPVWLDEVAPPVPPRMETVPPPARPAAQAARAEPVGWRAYLEEGGDVPRANKALSVPVLLLLICVVCFAGSLLGGSEDTPRAPSVDTIPVGETRAPARGSLDEYTAGVACEGFVRDRLRAPSTADFPASARATPLGGGRYRLTASVDSENAFGAMLRTPFVCVVEARGDSFRLESLEILE